MTNEEKVEETEDEIVDDVIEDKVDDKPEEETTDWEAKFKEEEGRRKRAETKLSKKKETSKTDKTSTSDLDYGQKAFLVANGIKGSKETELVKNIMSDTGKTLEDVMASKYFNAELEEMRELKSTEDALPKSSKRTGQSSADTVDYWLAKGELPTDRKLRQKVVNARIDKEKNKSVFE